MSQAQIIDLSLSVDSDWFVAKRAIYQRLRECLDTTIKPDQIIYTTTLETALACTEIRPPGILLWYDGSIVQLPQDLFENLDTYPAQLSTQFWSVAVVVEAGSRDEKGIDTAMQLAGPIVSRLLGVAPSLGRRGVVIQPGIEAALSGMRPTPQLGPLYRVTVPDEVIIPDEKSCNCNNVFFRFMFGCNSLSPGANPA